MGGSTTISNSETRAEALKLQSSSFGVAKTVLHGTNRLQMNLVDFGDFTAIATTTTQESGGKGGGGVRQVNTTYTYTASAVLAVCRGPIKGTGKIWRGKESWPAGEGPSAASLQMFYGGLDQSVWSVLNTMHGGTHAQNYSGMAIFCLQDYDLGSNASLENHNIEVMGPGSLMPGAQVLDANGADICSDWLCSPVLGLGQPYTILGDLARYRDYCYASGLLLSPALTEQAPLADRFKQLGRLTNSTMLVVEGKVQVVPLGTEPLSRAYPSAPGPTTTYTYTPDNVALFDLTPDHLLDRGDEPLVSIKRKSPADACNVVTVEFTDRSNEYAVGRASVKDQTSVDLYGAKPADTINAPWICDHEVANRLAWIELQRNLQVLNEYVFELPWNFAALLPTNVVTLTDPDWELDQHPVQITAIRETASGFEVTAEDFIGEVAAEPLYVLPGTDAFRQNYAAVPGDTVIDAVFEAPFEMTETGLEVWLAVHGATADWGGCHVWVSVDGVEYRKVYTQWGVTRAGKLDGAVGSSPITFDVDSMSGVLLSGSALDASVGATLCYIGGSNPEFVAYQTATLISAGSYALGDVVRGIFGSVARAHLDDTPFVRCDKGVARSGPLGLSMVGRQIYIKCQSFNVFGLNEQELASVTASTYTITGRFSRQLEDPTNLCLEGNFDLLPLGQKPATWDGDTVEAVSGQPFTRALRITADLTAESGARFVAKEGRHFHVTAVLDSSSSDVATGIGIQFFDQDGNDLGFVAAGLSVAAGASWAARSGVVVAPAGVSHGVTAVQRAPGGTGFSQVASIVVRRQSQTLEIQENAATEVFSSTVDTLAVTAYPVSYPGGGPPYGSRQVVTSIVVTVDAPCIAVVTVTAQANYTNGSFGISPAFGGSLSTVVTMTTNYLEWMYGGLNAPPGAGARVDGNIAMSGEFAMPAGTWTLALRAQRLSSADTANMMGVKFLVELVKL